MGDRSEPRLADIHRLATQLQLTLPPRQPSERWPERLRLLAAWAVKPDSYNAAFCSYTDRELQGPRREAFLAAREALRAQGSSADMKITDLPDYDLYCYGNGRLRSVKKLPSAIAITPGLTPDYRAFLPQGVEWGRWNLGGHGEFFQIQARYDPTPNEWGIRAWCLQVLAARGWRSPLSCDLAIARPDQWRNAQGPAGSHPIADSGAAQLAAWGIAIADGQWRPTAEALIWDTTYYLVDRQGAIRWFKPLHPGLSYEFPEGVRKERVHPLWQDWRNFSHGATEAVSA